MRQRQQRNNYRNYTEEKPEEEYEKKPEKSGDLNRAKRRALHILERSDRTEQELRDKLAKNYLPEVVDAAVEYVKSYHYIDDRQYAMDYIEYHQESKTKQKLLQSLMSKGLSKELILECFDEIVGDRKKELEEEQILKILRKKNYDPEQWTFEEKQRLMASLYRKGFSSELIHVHFYLT